MQTCLCQVAPQLISISCTLQALLQILHTAQADDSDLVNDVAKSLTRQAVEAPDADVQQLCALDFFFFFLNYTWLDLQVLKYISSFSCICSKEQIDNESSPITTDPYRFFYVKKRGFSLPFKCWLRRQNCCFTATRAKLLLKPRLS